MRKGTLVRVLIGTCCAALIFFVMPWADVHGQAGQEPIRIGVDIEMTGVMSETSMNVKQGYDIYLQEIGYKVAGRPIKLIEYDNKTDPKISVEVAQKLVEKD
jgi:ABC-type branched-subunit amino acid transport system substrate-binding protein